MAKSMRKSKPPAKEPIGNVAKYLSYREAWARISAARRQGFHLEAVTLLESIISDRLITYLLAVGDLVPLAESGKTKYPLFGQLIEKWKRQCPEPIVAGQFENLQESIDAWRKNRNCAIHEVVRVEAGATIMRIDQFLTNAEQASREGESLAKALANWCRKYARAKRANDTMQHIESGH